MRGSDFYVRTMSKNLVVCCDGTNNQFGSCNTNVVRLVQVLDRDPARQLIYYDPGVGTMPEPGFWSPVGKWFSKVFGLAFGAGLEGKVGRAYMFLMRHYEHLSNLEIAEALSINPPAASMRYLRALRKLRELLEQNEEEDESRP